MLEFGIVCCDIACELFAVSCHSYILYIPYLCMLFRHMPQWQRTTSLGSLLTMCRSCRVSPDWASERGDSSIATQQCLHYSPCPPLPQPLPLPCFIHLVLSAALTFLQKELVPDNPPVAASAEYRKSLACSLFYKVYQVPHMARNILYSHMAVVCAHHVWHVVTKCAQIVHGLNFHGWRNFGSFHFWRYPILYYTCTLLYM